ncbi:glycosyltransferase family 4 protein [Marivirga arenosa]|uniref:Glycosyltransferase family 4 protein n=1 Tax=Marivirga arenosa TaxID=3059076 RepID=A0AA51N6A1_9BACT|nr:glycosyltransferase family 4 protein [Marivirga sp. ABR2-2]WMN06808.1 glycosyltransferase family 4 protein [Marivirga sp. ABR2-2]
MAITRQKSLSKILFIQDSLGTGGAERSNANLWYFLRSQGIDIKILVLEHRTVGIEKEILEAGFDVTFLKKGNLIKTAKKIAGQIKAFNPDLVHSVLFKATLRARLSKLFTSFTLVESLVNCTYDPSRLKDQNLSAYKLTGYRLLDKFTAHLFGDFYIPITETVKKHYQSYLGLNASKMNVIFRGRKDNACERENVRTQIAENESLNPDKIWLLQVGRQEFQKGHIHTLKALARLPVPIKNKIELLFLGREGNASKSIQNYLKETDLVLTLHFLGHRSDVAQFMKAADIFLFPSLYEGLGGSLIEAQAAELPIICSNIPVLNEVVEKNKNALMFAAGNEQEFAKKIQELIENADLRKEMGEYSFKRFEKLFQIDKIHEEMLEFYKSVLTDKVRS